MKGPHERTKPGAKETSRKAEGARRREGGREIASTVKQWAKEKMRIKKTPVDPGEGGSGQP